MKAIWWVVAAIVAYYLYEQYQGGVGNINSTLGSILNPSSGSSGVGGGVPTSDTGSSSGNPLFTYQSSPFDNPATQLPTPGGDP